MGLFNPDTSLSKWVTMAVKERQDFLAKKILSNSGGALQPPHLQCDFSFSLRQGSASNLLGVMDDFMVVSMSAPDATLSWGAMSGGGLFGMPVPSVSLGNMVVKYFRTFSGGATVLDVAYESQFVRGSVLSNSGTLVPHNVNTSTGPVFQRSSYANPSNQSQRVALPAYTDDLSDLHASGLLAVPSTSNRISLALIMWMRTGASEDKLAVELFRLKKCRFSTPVPSINLPGGDATEWTMSVFYSDIEWCDLDIALLSIQNELDGFGLDSILSDTGVSNFMA
jgi:hypothetical protein|nr:MAG TPA: hypothetical protein [Caudoviricetes sp.]